MADSVTVITLTRGRPLFLSRAMRSVQEQDYAGAIVHLVLIDGCISTASTLAAQTPRRPRQVSVVFVPRRDDGLPVPARLAGLRNHAVRIASTRWVAFLDDDNEYLQDHLSSLVDTAVRTRCQAVHSHRLLYRFDGSPYVEPRMPWRRDPAEGRRVYDELCAAGVMTPGANVLHDRADPHHQPHPLLIIDTSTWLINRTLLLRCPFPEQYSEEECTNGIQEDDKLLWLLMKQQVPIASSGRPTLKYYLGGYSNAF